MGGREILDVFVLCRPFGLQPNKVNPDETPLKLMGQSNLLQSKPPLGLA